MMVNTTSMSGIISSTSGVSSGTCCANMLSTCGLFCTIMNKMNKTAAPKSESAAPIYCKTARIVTPRGRSFFLVTATALFTSLFFIGMLLL